MPMPVEPTGPTTPTDLKLIMPPATSIRLASNSVRLRLKRKSISAPVSSTSPVTSTSPMSTEAAAKTTRPRSGRSDAATAVGLALGFTRKGTGAVPFDVVCALARHAEAADPTARLVLDWLKRREARRLNEHVAALGRRAGYGRTAGHGRYGPGSARICRSASSRLRLVATKGDA